MPRTDTDNLVDALLDVPYRTDDIWPRRSSLSGKVIKQVNHSWEGEMTFDYSWAKKERDRNFRFTTIPHPSHGPITYELTNQQQAVLDIVKELDPTHVMFDDEVCRNCGSIYHGWQTIFHLAEMYQGDPFDEDYLITVAGLCIECWPEPY